MAKLTKRIVESTSPQEKDILLWDSELKGFCCKITPVGKRSYMLFYRTADGRQRKPLIGAHGAITCEQARDIAQKWLSEAAQGKDPSAEKKALRSSPTIKELSLKYMVEYAPHKKASSSKEDQRLWDKQILPVLGSFKVASLTREDILKFHHSLKQTPITANRVLSLLSKTLNLAELWEFRPDHSNPCRHVKKYAENKRERFLSQEEITRLMSVLDEEEKEDKELPSVFRAIRLLILTGCRLNEVLTLRWSEVDLKNQCFNLSDSKTGKKTVYLAPAAIQVLNSIPRMEGNPYVIYGKKDGAHLVGLQKPWTRIREKADLNIRIHDLRHTFASVAASNGLSLPIIGALLGHRQTQTTQRYAHLVGKVLLDACEMIGKQLTLGSRH
ncbi:MAG: tyrosine-type recombinase/integrase [Pseudomonadota bacterium]